MHLRQAYLLVLFFLLIPERLQAQIPASFAELSKKVKPAVVNISTTRQAPAGRNSMAMDPFFKDFFGPFYRNAPDPRQQEQHSLGTGFIITATGDILTNNHVIEEASEILVTLDDGRKLKADVVGKDSKLDIAVLRIKAPGTYPAVTMGDSQALEVGAWVVAVGNPFGLGHTVTAGIVSAKARVLGAGPYDDFIQTDASINPGNSGGPLFNVGGEVVGINTAIIASGQGIGFAIPINLVKDVLAQLQFKGRIARGWLGIAIREMTDEEMKKYGLTKPQGAFISEAVPGGPAANTGIKAGDIILEFNDRPVETSHMLPSLVAKEPPGAKAKIVFLHEGKRFEREVVLGSLDEPKAVAGGGAAKDELLGMAVRDLSAFEKQRVSGGVVVLGVKPESMAHKIGIAEGDILLELNGEPIKNLASFKAALGGVVPGQVMRLGLARGPYMYYFAFRKE